MANKQLVVEIVSDAKRFVSGLEDSLGQLTKIAKNANILGGVEDQITELKAGLKGLGDQLETALTAPKLDTSFFEDLNKRLDSVEKKYDSFRHTMSDMQNDLSKTDTARLSKEMDKLQESIGTTQQSFKDLQTVSSAFYSEKHELKDIKSLEELKAAYEASEASMRHYQEVAKETNDPKAIKQFEAAREAVIKFGTAIDELTLQSDKELKIFDDTYIDNVSNTLENLRKNVGGSFDRIEEETRNFDFSELLSGEMKEAQEAVKNFTLKDGKILVPLEVETTAAKLSKEIQGIIDEVTARIKQSPISVKLDVDESAAVELRGKIEKMFDTISTELENQYNKINTKNTSLVKDMGLSDYENSLKIISDNIATTSARISDLTKAFKDFGKSSGGALQIDTTSIDKASQSVDELVTSLSPQHLNDGQLRSRFESIEKSLEDMLDDGGLLKAKREEYEQFFSLFDQYKSLGGKQTFASLFSGQTLDTSRITDKEYLQSYQQQSERAKQNLQTLREEYEKYVNAQTQGAADINAANEKTASGYVETSSVFKQLLEILDQISAKLNTLNFDQLGSSLEVVRTIVTQFENLQTVLSTGLEGFNKITDQINEVQTELKETRTVAEESKDALSSFTKDFDSKKVVDSLDKISNEYEEIAAKGKEISKVDMITDAQESVSEVNRIADAFEALSIAILGVIDSIDRVGVSVKELGSYMTDNTGLDTYFNKIQTKLGKSYANSDTQRIDLRSSKKEIQEVLDMYQQYKQMGGSKNLFDLSDNQQTVLKMQKLMNNSPSMGGYDVDIANQFTQQSALIDKALESQIQSIQVLRLYINDVTSAIEEQNAVLKASESQFANSIDSEVTYLKVLLDYVENVKNSLTEIGNIQFKNTTEALKATTDAAAGKSNLNAGKSASTAEVDQNTEKVKQLISYYEQLNKLAYRFVEAQEAAQQGNASKSQLKVLDDYNNILVSIEQINSGLTLTKEQQEKVAKAASEHTERLKESKEQLDKINQSLEKQKADALTDKLTKQQEALRKLKDELENSGKYSGYETLVKQIDDAVNSAEVLKAKIKNSGISQEVEEQAKSFDKLTKEIDKSTKSFEKLDSSDTAIQNLSRSMQAFLRTNSNLSDETIEKVQALLKELQNGPSKVDLERIANGFKDIKVEAAAAGQIGNSFFDQLGEKAKSFGAYLLTYVQFQDFIRYFKQGMEIVHDFDDALTEMMKVSDESMERLREYQKESFQMAADVGTTALQLQQSTADFMRLGESLDDAAKSAQAANVLMNVSEFGSISQATDSLIAMSYAYDDFEKMDIIDKLNNIGKFCLNTW